MLDLEPKQAVELDENMLKFHTELLFFSSVLRITESKALL